MHQSLPVKFQSTFSEAKDLIDGLLLTVEVVHMGEAFEQKEQLDIDTLWQIAWQIACKKALKSLHKPKAWLQSPTAPLQTSWLVTAYSGSSTY